MSLEIFVGAAANLPNLESFGKIDPYCNIQVQGITKKSTVKKAELNPVWNETLIYDFKGQPIKEQDEIKIFVKDWERLGNNRLIGGSTVLVKEILKRGPNEETKMEVTLNDSNQRPIGATLSIAVLYKPPPGSGGNATPGGGREISSNQDEDVTDGTNEEGKGTDTADGRGGGSASGKTGMAGPKKKPTYSVMKNNRDQLSTKQQDFQLRLKIVEGRQLHGSNISPVCRITLCKQTKQTKILRSTNSPAWNEIFFFNFFHSPAKLFEEILLIQVFDSKKLRSDAFIGSFKIEVGMIYDETSHAFVNKWLLLCNPEQILEGHKGYVKISVCLLGPGDEAPSFEVKNIGDINDDIESNLLRPAGIVFKPATFALKLFCAEDLPRMDSNVFEGVKVVFGSDDRKELVDPYFTFSFAGREVKSKIIYNSHSPQWNTELRLGLWFPSMCENLKFQLHDWDRFTKHDCIGTSFLNTAKISNPGYDSKDDNGFLPTFGPCYVNFYGSPREFTNLPSEYEELNLAKGEGVAYRGRVMVELTTILGELPLNPSVDILEDDVLIAQKFMRRRKFKLHTVFLDASMISTVDAPVEFEVSIGNYGNRLDELLPPSVCSTQPTNAVFDGCNYYFLPWANTKPCVAVECNWEDITFRIDTINFLTGVKERLEENLSNVRLAVKANIPLPELAQGVIALLDQLITDCNKPLPSVENNQMSNDLDRRMFLQRKGILGNIVENAMRLRAQATDVTELLSEVELMLLWLQDIIVEPQNSIPDVMIWMISGEKRIAYHRMPAHHLMWSPNPDLRGKYCGKLNTFSLKYPGAKAQRENRWEIPALLRARIWLGLEVQEKEWHKMNKEGELTVYAETYENQVSVLGKWTTKGPTMSRPPWSDLSGKVELKREEFKTPPGWTWEGEWYVNPEMSMLYEKDAGHTRFMEDLFECQSRIPGAFWNPAARPWTDVKGDTCIAKAEITLPEGWEWMDDWQVDVNRAVDENGWEYVVEATLGGYGPVEKTYHMCRRRRWVRTRLMTKKQALNMEQLFSSTLSSTVEGWEYAPLFSMKYHAKERKMDLVRRRRWHRKMVADSERKESSNCLFQFSTNLLEETSVSENQIMSITSTPRMFMVAKQKSMYQLRAYIYQGRNLLAGDSDGLSDPFARVVFLNQSQATERLTKTLCPTWDQSLLFDSVVLYGDPLAVKSSPPEIIIEFFDHDNYGSAEFLGRTKALPLVKLNPKSDVQRAMLNWYNITKGNNDAGELLASFELYLVDGKNELPFLPPRKGKTYMVPNGIRPEMVRTGVEVMCWGLRNMKRFQLTEVEAPSIEIEIQGELQQSKSLTTNSKNPNFSDNVLFFDLMLPKEELYAPPINIRVKDNRTFGRKPLVGVHSIKSLQQYIRTPLMDAEEQIIVPRVLTAVPSFSEASATAKTEYVVNMSVMEPPSIDSLEDDIDWWSKFYASIGDLEKCRKYLEMGYDKLKVYPTELENVKAFGGFNDFCNTYSLQRGKSAEEEESAVIGEFKGTFCVYQLPGDFNAPLPQRILKNLPQSGQVECIVRVYVLRAIDLQPSDPTGLADPYVQVRVGDQKVDNGKDYIPNTLNPIFGRMFELKAVLPKEKDLLVRIKDHDTFNSNDTIGETTIDLENRYLSRLRSTVGLPTSYCTSGVCQWRDNRLPSALLDEFCLNNFRSDVPNFNNDGTACTIGKRNFNLTDFEQKSVLHKHLGEAKERLSLYILNTLPQQILGKAYVPEHVETRPIYSTLRPGIEQGKVQMWIDIFPLAIGTPGPPVNISARKPRDYELRVVIWNTKDVILDETSITGEKMSDIYVKGWIGSKENVQSTDVHYRSLDGEGNFNWRFVFPFKYIPSEQCIVSVEKDHFWNLDARENRIPPVFTVQVWDNDKFNPDDFLGSLEMNLLCMPMSVKSSEKCSLNQLGIASTKSGSTAKFLSLYDQKRVKGFWPFSDDVNGKKQLTGKLEMELELVTGSDIKERPVAKARDEPNQHPHLDPPDRPATSFFWFTSPCKSFKFIIWKKFKWYFIGLILLIILIFFIIVFIYAIPDSLAKKIIGVK